MKLRDFERDILDPMDSQITDFDRMRVWIAYQDVGNLVDLMTILDLWIGGRIQKLQEIGDNAEMEEVLLLHGRVSSLHKAVIEFANVFMTILVHEAQQRPASECTIGKLVQRPLATKITKDVLHQAYCLSMYRNKVVIHHEVPRGDGHLMEADGTRRLWPMPHPKSIDQADVQHLLERRSSNAILEIQKLFADAY